MRKDLHFQFHCCNANKNEMKFDSKMKLDTFNKTRERERERSQKWNFNRIKKCSSDLWREVEGLPTHKGHHYHSQLLRDGQIHGTCDVSRHKHVSFRSTSTTAPPVHFAFAPSGQLTFIFISFYDTSGLSAVDIFIS